MRIGLFSHKKWERTLALAAVAVIAFMLVGAQPAVGDRSPDRAAAVGKVVLSVTPFLTPAPDRSPSAAAKVATMTAGPTSPPFTECPPIGFDSSCGVLVVVTDSGGAVLSDASQPPYDGIEDTLTGVQNNSTGTITTLVLSSNTDLFGFDGDGLCTQSGAPSGCPFGPTGYEGPGTSFSDINPDASGGIVNFSPGLAPGQSAYFSLEESLTSAIVFAGGPTPGEQGGPPNGSEHPTTCSSGQPVNCATGVFWHSFDDLNVPGRGVPLDFARTYSSASAAADGPLGFGWTHDYAMSLAIDPSSGNATVTQENGAVVTFVPSGGGTYAAAPRVLARLRQNGDGTYTFTRNVEGVDYTFSSAGKLLQAIDRNGYATTLAYDGSGRLTSVVDAAGRALSFTYSGTHVASVADPAGRTESFSYDGAGNLVAATDPTGGSWSFTYDANHLLLSMTDPRGGVTTNVYDGSNRVVSQTDPAGRTTARSYTGSAPSAAGGSTTITDPKGNTSVFHYQNLELQSETRAAGTPAGATTAFTYDPATLGRTSVTDANGHTSTATYDGDGNAISFTDAIGRSTSASYNAFDEPVAVTDASGVTTTRTYDSRGNLATVSRPLGSTAAVTLSLTYGDSAHPGDVTAVTDPNGSTTRFTRDLYGDIVSVTDPVGGNRTLAYDVVGELTTATSARGNTTSYVYDGLGRLTRTTGPLGHTSVQAYDANSNLTSSTDGNGNRTNYAYNADNELTAVTRADGTTLRYAHDGNGNQTSQTDAAGKATTYSFDALNRVVMVTDPLNRTTAFSYDGAGNRTGMTDPSGRTTAYAYDAANQVTSIQYSDGRTPNVSFTYTANGSRASMHDGTGTTSYTYDSINRLVSVTNGAGKTTSFGYDGDGNETSLTYPNGNTVTRAYDAAGRLTSVTDWLGHRTTFASDADGNATAETYPNGVVASTAYDAAGAASSITDTVGGSTLASFTYARDANEQLTRAAPTGSGQGANEAYAYNSLNQLTSVNGAGYSYDAADNLTRLPDGTSLTYDAANEATKIAPPGVAATPVAYDAEGNRLNGLAAGGAPVAYAYDQANRLVSSSGGAGGHVFAYAAGTGCDAITVTNGGDDFSAGALWSNGGITASGKRNTASTVLVAKAPPACSFPSQFTPPGPTPVAPRAAGDWPVPLPAPPSSCNNGNAPTINASWLASHAPGVYCWTGQISISASGATFNGYEFVSKGATQPGAITVLQKSTFVGSDATGKVVLYATAGGISFNQAVTLTGTIMAPQGKVLFGGAGTAVKSGFVEAATVTLNNGPSTFVGSGPDASPPGYAYDGDGLRTSRTTAGTTSNFVWDVSRATPLLLTDGSTSYVYDDLGLPIEQIDGSGTILYYQHDQLGSTRLLTNAAAAPMATFVYDAYGNLTTKTGTAETPLRWAGQYQDADTGLYYLRARYYDPRTGQFLTRDPIASITQEPYAYVGGNPLDIADLSGLGCGLNPVCYVSEGASDAWNTAGSIGSTVWHATSDVVNSALPIVHDVAGVIAVGATVCAIVTSETIIGGVTCGTIALGAAAVQGATGTVLYLQGRQSGQELALDLTGVALAGVGSVFEFGARAAEEASSAAKAMSLLRAADVEAAPWYGKLGPWVSSQWWALKSYLWGQISAGLTLSGRVINLGALGVAGFGYGACP